MGCASEFGDKLTISLPSMRVDSFSVRVAEAVATRGKHSITFAPEAGTERLRMTINKIVTDDDLYAAAENAFSQGWTNVKMYFMVGQPTETHEDIEGIVTLARKVREIGRRHHGGRARVRVSTSNFIPKAHTPFQWASQARPDVLRQRHMLPARRAEEVGRRVHVGGPGAQRCSKPCSRAATAASARRSTTRGETARASTRGTSTTTGRAGSARWTRAGLDPAFFAYR